MYVCQCFGVTDGVIKSLIKDGADTLEKIARACRAGSDCGDCCRMIQDLIDQHRGRPRDPESPG